jgi:hypothetical protein
MSAQLRQGAAGKGGCGCGGSSGRGGTACACGGKGCSRCQDQGFVRPRFFAGQLLTDEDLHQLDDYVTAKNRLHNRHLFGAGVVCGLEVTVNPCEPGKVTVQPGYALDCCGNDVVVPCPQVLAVRDEIRRLRYETAGGQACGEPCEDPKPAAGDAQAKPAEPPPVRRYDLYVAYCEEPTDPVSAYLTDEPCTQPQCEPSRVREGFRFFLRCPPAKETLANDLLVCVCEHLGGDNQLAERASNTQLIQASVRQTAVALQAIDKDGEGGPNFTEEHAKALVAARKNLEAAIGKYTTTPDPDSAREVLDLLTLLASPIVRYQMLSADKKKDVEEKLKDYKPAATVRDAVDFLDGRDSKLYAQLAKSPRTELERYTAGVVIERVRFWVKNPDKPPASEDPQERRLLAYGALVTAALQTRQAEDLGRLRDQLLERLDCDAPVTSAALLRQVRATTRPTLAKGTGLKAGTEQLAGMVDTFGGLLGRYAQQAVCACLLPPCPDCKDQAVLLASLRVQNCEVVEVCNLARTFVLTGPALRYWVPLIGLLGKAIENLCCTAKPEPTPKQSPLDRAAASPDTAALWTQVRQEPLRAVATGRQAGASAWLSVLAVVARFCLSVRKRSLGELQQFFGGGPAPAESPAPARAEAGGSPGSPEEAEGEDEPGPDRGWWSGLFSAFRGDS